MMIKIHDVNGSKIAEIFDDIAVKTPEDALDWMATAAYDGASGLILHEAQLNPNFFDLSSGLAGKILLKFTNYHMKLAVIGDFKKFQSESLQSFIRESNRGKQFFFVLDFETAVVKLTSVRN
jgi:hypothetical protein